MPLGNLTSQFFANLYLNELDQFVKQKLKAKYYVRYVDDFIILHKSKRKLEFYQEEIDNFLENNLLLKLHPDKSKILKLQKGINFLGFRIFYYQKLIRKANLNKFHRKFNNLKKEYRRGQIDREGVIEKFEGWTAYISNADTYKYRRQITREFNKHFPLVSQTKINNKKVQKNITKKIREASYQYSTQKTLQLLRKGLNIERIAEKRDIKISTVYEHLVKLIKHRQISLYKLLPRNKIFKIRSKIKTKKDTLKEIKERLNDDLITYNEISLVLASFKRNKKRKRFSPNTNR